MLRLRRAMRELARGEDVQPVRFRDGDFWHDFAEEFNAIAARIQKERAGDEPESDEQAQESVEQEEPVTADAG